MRLIKNTTELIGIKDQNIKISLIFETDTHIEIQVKLDYPAPSCPHCLGKMIKYDFQKPSKTPLLEQAGTPTLLRLKKRRLQCKSCRRVTVAETSIVEKNCQISNLVRQKVQFITMDMSGAYIPLAKRLFPNAKIVLDRFHIIQHLGRAFLKTRIAIMNQFDKKSLPYRALKNHWRLFQKDSRKLSLNPFYSKTFHQTLCPHEVVEKTLNFSEELANYYNLYQLLLFHFQEKRGDEFFELIEENISKVNHYFKTVFRTFLRHKPYIKNALETHYSNAKLEGTNKLIKDIKRLGFGFRNFINFRKRVFITLNIQKEKTYQVLSRC